MTSQAPKHLIARFTPIAGQLASALSLLNAYGKTVRAEVGNKRFEPYVSDHDIVVIETYENDAAFNAHISDPRGQEFNAMLSKLLIGDVRLEFLTPAHPSP